MNIRDLTKFVFIIVFNFIYLTSIAIIHPKSTISGIILDKDTRLPLSDVNIFLAHTTIGAASDHIGKFRIESAPEGIYDLIFDCMGYETKSIKIQIIQSQALSFTVELKPKIYSTDQIQIIAEKPKEWLKRLEIFIREFIGQSRNARECVVLNSEVLKFQIDSVTNKFLAFSDSILRIRNNALGYHINVKLVQFEYSYKDATCLYEMYPIFRELKSDDEKQLSRWIENRQKSFKGSLRHFISLFTQDQYFPIFKLYTKKATGDKFYVSVDNLKCEQIENSSLLKISFDYFLGIDYYRFGYPEMSSMLRLDQGYAYIDSLGNIYGPITKRGAWSEERLADLLPYDYNPNNPEMIRHY